MPPAYLAGSDQSLFNLLDLWRNGEAGIWQDPFDLPYQYQESTGVTAAAVNSPVGLALDKKLSLVRGAELVTNGTFDADVSGWTGLDGGTPAWVAGRARLTGSGAFPAMYRNVVTVAGRRYRVEFDYEFLGTTATAYLNVAYAGTGSGSVTITSASGASGRIGADIVATGSATSIAPLFNAADGGYFDNISVREIPGIHLSQATAPARPLLKNDSGIYSWIFDGTDDGLASATFSAGTLTSNMDCFIALKRNSADYLVTSYPSDKSAYFGVIEAASMTVATTSVGANVTYFVNGVPVAGGTGTSRDQLHIAVPVGSWAILEVRNLDLSAWTDIGFGAFNAPYNLNANIAAIVLCPAQTDSRRAQIRRALGAKVGLSL